jgi:predicted HTH transcriptional regulator
MSEYETTDEHELLIDSLIAQAESRNLEFKSARTNYDTEKAIEYCAALANEGSGDLVLGVTDAREVVGTAAFADVAELERRVFEEIQVKVLVEVLSYRGKRVLRVRVPSRRKGEPIQFKGRFPMRAGESLTSMTLNQLHEIMAETRIAPDLEPASGPIEFARVETLLDIERFFQVMPLPSPGDATAVQEALQAHHLIGNDASGLMHVTRLGALLVGRNIADFPGLQLRRIRVVKYSGVSREHAVFEHIETRGYAIAFEEVLKTVTALLPISERIEGGARQTIPVYPPTALREFFANALVHQDLSLDGVQLMIEIFDDRLEIRNAGHPLIDVTRFVDETRSRNPHLAEAMRLAGLCEVRGSGVERALTQIEDLLRPAPTFRAENGATTVRLTAESDFNQMSTEDRVWAAFLHACVRYQASERLTNSSLRDRFGLPASKTTVVSQTITAAVASGLLKPDPVAGGSRRMARYMPFFGQPR